MALLIDILLFGSEGIYFRIKNYSIKPPTCKNIIHLDSN